MTLLVKINNCKAWFIDSGASIQMTCNADYFVTYHEKVDGTKIYLGDDICHGIIGYGVCVKFLMVM